MDEKQEPRWDKTVETDDLPDASADDDFSYFLVVLKGLNPGVFYRMDRRSMVLGRREECDIFIPQRQISSRHCELTVNGGQVYVRDSGSRNGTFVDNRKVDGPTALPVNSTLLVGHTVLRLVQRSEAEMEREEAMYRQATTDQLTGVPNRFSFNEQAETTLAFARRHGVPLSLLILDADHFKRVNDTYGHLAGDEVLTMLGRILQQAKRGEDLLARFGGEEFVMLLLNCTSEQAVSFAERLRLTIGSKKVNYDGQAISVTVSIGLAGCGNLRNATLADLIQMADEALYEAKEGGRNRVCLWEDRPSDPENEKTVAPSRDGNTQMLRRDTDALRDTQASDHAE
jgi:two-component system, cell cycle response regulator